MKSSFKSTSGFMRIWRACGYSLQGLAAALRHESAFRQELLLVALLAPCAFVVGRTPLQILLLLTSLAGILLVELIKKRWPTPYRSTRILCSGAPRTSVAPQCCWRCSWLRGFG